MPRLSRSTAAAVFAVCSPLVAAPGDEIGVLIPTPEGFNVAGWSVALKGDYMLVGAPADAAQQSNLAPQVYVYDTATSALLWSLDEPASIAGSASSREFGLAVAVSGDKAFVTARRAANALGQRKGAMVQFDLLTGEITRIYTPPTDGARIFGSSVAASGDLVAVGASDEYLDGFGGFPEGAAYLYDSTTGALLHRCVAPDMTSIQMGNAIAVSESRLLVGASGTHSQGITRAGRAYLFDASSGNIVATLEPNDLYENARFGFSVALNGDYAFVSAPGTTDPKDFGAVYVFEASTGVQVAKIEAPGQGGGVFGGRLAVDGEFLAISAGWEASQGSFDFGAVYLYQYPTQFLWDRVVPQSYSGNLWVGSVALDDSRLLVGSDGLLIDGVRRGGAFIFEAPGASSPCPGDADGSGSIDIKDLSLILSDFGQPVTPGTSGDFDGSGVVDLADLNTVLGLFGADCP